MEKPTESTQLTRFLVAFAVMAAIFFGLMVVWFLVVRFLFPD